MNTNFQMLKELEESYSPKRRGVLDTWEMKQISEALCLDGMDILQLRNLRDFTVMYFAAAEDWESLDKMSAITTVIDMKIWKLGGEV